MAEIEDINRNITYVRGPQGQTVVIVPPLLPPIEKAGKDSCCSACAVVNITLASISLFLGLIYGAMALSGRVWTEIIRGFAIAAFSFSGIGVFLVLLACCMYRHMGQMKRKQIKKFMHIEGSPHCLAYQAFEERSEEEAAFMRNHENFTPENTQAIETSYPGTQSFQGHDSQQEPAMAALPSYHDYPQRSYSDVPSHLYGQPSAPPDRRGESMIPMDHYSQHRPELSNPGRFIPGTMSPLADRSFSPSSDTPYLSYQISGSESH